MLMGMQEGFTKFCFFLSLWDSRCTAKYYIKHDWEPRKIYEPGTVSVQHIPLVNPIKIFLPPLHIKLKLTECLVKAMADTITQELQYVSKKSPNITTANWKTASSWDVKSEKSWKMKQLGKAFKWVCINFLGRKKSPDFSDSIQKLLNVYKVMGYHMSLKSSLFSFRFRCISLKPWWRARRTLASRYKVNLNTAIEASETTLWWQITAVCCSVML